MKKVSLPKLLLAFAVFPTLIIGTVFFLQIDNSVTAEDISIYNEIVAEYSLPTIKADTTFEAQVNQVKLIQQTVLDFAPYHNGIPYCQRRSIKDVYEAGHGACYDKSYVIEKILVINGFKVRHASIYYCQENKSLLRTFFTSGSPSHAVCEVLTKRGWMLVDPLMKYVGLSKDSVPLTLKEIEKKVEDHTLSVVMPDEMQWNYAKPFFFLYGVYSRNGYLYPPYNFIPDYRANQLKYNF